MTRVAKTRWARDHEYVLPLMAEAILMKGDTLRVGPVNELYDHDGSELRAIRVTGLVIEPIRGTTDDDD